MKPFPVLSAALLLPMTALAASEPVGLVPFIGRFHILALHFPVGLLITVLVIELWNMRRDCNTLEENTPPFLLLGAISAIVASALGLMLEESGGYSGETIFWHKWLGIAVSVMACMAYVLKARWKKNPTSKKRTAYRIVLVATVITLTAGAHKGGDLTHGKDFLDPAVMKPKVIAAQAGYFEKQVWPIMEERCIECHGPEKQKGDLRLDSPEAIMAEGENGFIVVAGDPDKSSFYWMTTLDEDDDDVMPSKGDLCPVEEQEILKKWIVDGADFEGWTGPAE